MANSYQVGDLVRVTGTFTNSASAATDPTAVIAKIRSPAGVITTYTYGVDAELVKSATGIYYVDVSATTHGNWWYRFYATGSGQSAAETYFVVSDSTFD